jgi:hypothetical protein
VGVEGVILEDQTNTPLGWGEVIDFLAVERHRSMVRLFKASNDPQ